MPSDFFSGAGKYQGCLTVKTSDDIIGTQQSTEYFAVEPIVTSNCFINTGAQTKTFKAVKGNSNASTGEIAKVEVLWESFGTDVTPSAGDIVSSVSYSNGYITYTTTANKGNAVIAAKNSDGTILWSWHIWCTDQPAEQVYRNGAGTMMDRNLGATDTTIRSVGALGLLYQWGRKDPFIGSSSTASAQKAATVGMDWKESMVQDNSVDKDVNLRYAIQNPTTFITSGNEKLYDWYCQSNAASNRNDSLWMTSGGGKTMYDPCPLGWRVPDGDVWSKAFGESSFADSLKYDKGFDFGSTSHKLVDEGICWYPAAGIYWENGTFSDVSGGGYYWSSTPYVDLGEYIYHAVLMYISAPRVYDDIASFRCRGRSVRCMKE